MTTAYVLNCIVVAIAVGFATALAILAEPAVRQARAARRKIR